VRKFLSIFVCFVLSISLFNAAHLNRVEAADSGVTTINRIGGADRFQVAVGVSQSAWTTSDTVIISYYGAFADALTATPLAIKYDAPILLTHKDFLTKATQEEIKRLKATKAIIIGGTGSVYTKVEEDLKRIGVTPIKRFGGKDRFEVSRNIAKEFPIAKKAVLAYGMNFPDALAIAPYAAENGYPILLTAVDYIPEVIKPVIYNSDVTHTVISGGPASVGDKIYNELKSKGKNPLRIGGQDRYEVAANIVSTLNYGTSNNKAYIATGLTFADALTGSVLAAKNHAPILLSHPSRPMPSIQNTIFNYSKFNLTLLGGTASVPDQTVKSLISYRKAVVNNDGTLNVVNTNYTTMDAVPLSNNNEVVVFGNQIVKMRDGMVYAWPSAGKSTVTVYNSAGGYVTYVSPNTEMKYISADSERVKVRVADVEGYVYQSQVKMLPWNAVKNRSSYYVSNGDLIHKVNNVSTVIGKAPSFMAAGTSYFSWDGYNFALSNGKAIGKDKQYFQYLPIRSKTAYTAEQLHSFIISDNNAEIKAWEQREGRTSPLRDVELIKAMVEAQNNYNINALFILSAAIHESAWGVSDIAYDKGNLYGVRAFDTNPATSAQRYDSYEQSVNEFADDYMSKGYTQTTDYRYNGGVTGHKGIGINVRYASDPNWGSRVAAHMYKIDKALGRKEFGKYKVMATTELFKVRADSNFNASVLYTYPKANIPVVILGEKQGAEYEGSTLWYKIISESTGQEVYIHSKGVKPLN
jgi:putative cell wall-binding protein/beta-N-acetylglucosaminidase